MSTVERGNETRKMEDQYTDNDGQCGARIEKSRRRRKVGGGRIQLMLFSIVAIMVLFIAPVSASKGDRLPEFKECVEICERENCGADAEHHTPIPLHHRLLFWTCPSECDYTCQHIITAQRLAASPPLPTVQFHGKWPFKRFLGIQEPFSVLFSFGNFMVHYNALHNKIYPLMPASYSLRPYYVGVAYVGMITWLCSMVFHTRDFAATEQLDYFAAGACTLYGTYYTVIRVFRLDRNTPRRRSVRRAWAGFCLVLYFCHVLYLKVWDWDYEYNMMANVVVGLAQNLLWTWFSVSLYKKNGRIWSVVPGVVVMWVACTMSLELLDFPPVWGCVDAHSLWHLGTIAPALLMYNFLVRDALEDMAGSERLKA